MRIRTNGMRSRSIAILMAGILWCFVGAIRTAAQQRVSKDPAEPLKGQPKPRILPRPAGAIARASIDEKMMKELIHEQVGCGTRLTISSWTDPKRGIGCGRDFVVPRLEAISKATGGKLQIVVDKFEMKSERTGAGPVHLENIYAVLSGDDPKLTKTIYIVVGDFDSRPSDVMDTAADAPEQMTTHREQR